ncbi:MAG: aquaporin [Gemmatimonadaceae bacterium]|nr:aquaporin [Gemmatimonadaceae bacterium]
MRDPLRHFTAELIGTFALVFVGSGAILLSKAPGSTIGLVEIALAHGLILSIMVTATMRISGHLNPAVTLGFVATQRIGGLMAGIYIVAQVLGAILAAYALKALFPAALYEAARGGGQFVALDVSSAQAYLLEGIGTFFLVFAVFGTAVDPRAPKVGGWAIGLTVAADILTFGPLTGAAVNPARALGPAVASGIYEGQLIYWIGPIIGGVLAALVYEHLLMHHGVEPVEHGPTKPV